MSNKDIAEMSDEEFEKMLPPEIGQDEEDVKEVEENEASVTNDEEPVENEVEEDSEEESEETEEEEKEEESEEPAKEEDSGSEEEKDNQTSEEQPPTPEVDYKGFYETIMKPIKANGKEFTPRNPQEAIQLMQMGANYTQKMQSIAPYRKKIQMLQNAGLLEDEKLNYLIDLSHGNKEAIVKLLKDSKLDPLDLNVNEEPKYVPGNHTVSDAEVMVQTIVDDLKSTPEGMDTLRLVQGWDQASLNEVWKEPSILATLNEQRQNGVYDLITKEMEHQRMLGRIPEGTSFLEAYKAVGDYCLRMKQAQMQQQAVQNLPKGPVQHRSVSNTQQVRKAAPSGRSKKSAQQFVDPFSLSDEEFEKQFGKY